MVVSSMPLSFAGNPNFVNTLPLYTFNIQFMYDNLNFSFLLWSKYFVTFLLPVSIVWPRSIYLSRGWSVVTNPSRGFRRNTISSGFQFPLSCPDNATQDTMISTPSGRCHTLFTVLGMYAVEPMKMQSAVKPCKWLTVANDECKFSELYVYYNTWLDSQT